MKAVYYICNNREWGHVSARVGDILDQEGFLQEHSGTQFGGVHFEPSFAEAVFTSWENEAFGVSHIVRRLGAEFNIPIYRHQKLRNPQELEW